MKDLTALLVGSINNFVGISRDAIHVPTIPCILGETLPPGTMVHLVDGRLHKFSGSGQCIGVIDPFIRMNMIPAGSTVLLFLRPGSIISLQHQWQHPAFDHPVDPNNDKLAWARGIIETMADDMGMSVDQLLDAAECYDSSGEYYTFYGHDTPSTSISMRHFWQAYEIYTGRTTLGDEGHFFSCAC